MRYIEILRPWVCVTVYLWLLELQAAFGNDAEPVLDRMADASAILWTLMLWATVLSAGIFLASKVFGATTISRVNYLACNTALILTTAFHFVVWLKKLQPYYPDVDLILICLLALCTVFSIWALKKGGKKHGDNANGRLPTLDECFYFVALPVIVASGLALTVKIFQELTAQGRLAHAFLADTLENKARPNVILIVADGLRAESMSSYGHFRKTTPHLERFAQRSNLYMQMHSNGTTTQPSMTTILSGRHPFSHGRLTRETPPYRDARNFLHILRDNGYRTASISSNRDAAVYALGFASSLSEKEYANFSNLTPSWIRTAGVLPTAMGNRMYENLSRIFPFLGFPGKTYLYGSSDDALDAAKRAIEKLTPPFFLFVHLHEPHDPYYRSEAFRGVFSLSDNLVKKYKFPSQFYGYYPPELQPFVSYYRDQYEESIQFLDAEVGKFISYLESSGWSDNLLIGFTADHGESFERGYFNHGEDLYESSTRIPLLIRFLNQKQGRKVFGLVQSTDIAPTILNAIGVTIPPWMDGQALTEDGDPREAETIAVNFKHPVRGVHYPLPTKLAIWSGRYKMIVLCDSSKVEVYDLAKDPGELVDLSPHSAEIVKLLKQQLALYLAAQLQGSTVSCSYH